MPEPQLCAICWKTVRWSVKMRLSFLCLHSGKSLSLSTRTRKHVSRRRISWAARTLSNNLSDSWVVSDRLEERYAVWPQYLRVQFLFSLVMLLFPERRTKVHSSSSSLTLYFYSYLWRLSFEFLGAKSDNFTISKCNNHNFSILLYILLGDLVYILFALLSWILKVDWQAWSFATFLSMKTG